MMPTADQREAREWSRRSSEAPFLSYWLVCGTARSSQGRAGFARRSGPLTARTVLQAIARKKGSRLPAVLLRPGKQACLPPVFQPVALPTNVDRGGMMQQPVQNGGGNDRISKDRAPITIAFVRSQDDAAAFVACAYQLEKDGGAHLVQWQVSHLIDNQNLRSQIHPHAPIESTFPISTPEIGDQIVRCHEVGSEAGLDRGLG